MRSGQDYVIVNSKGVTTAVLLASLYPDELSLERKRKLYEKANPGQSFQVKGRGER